MFAGALVPLAVLALGAARGTLGANPVAEALNQLGLLALIFLIASLACTPLKIADRLDLADPHPADARPVRVLLRRLHFTTYAGLDQNLDFAAISRTSRSGSSSSSASPPSLLLVPLAVTSTAKMLKRLGFARWKRLHRLAYVAAVLGVIHFIWRVKKDLTEPLGVRRRAGGPVRRADRGGNQGKGCGAERGSRDRDPAPRARAGNQLALQRTSSTQHGAPSAPHRG